MSRIGEQGFVVFQTIKSFKGLAADHVVLVDVDVPKHAGPFGYEDAHVAFTRVPEPSARQGLVVAAGL